MESPAQVGSRLVLALALGVIVLEVASLATGRYFDWNLKRGAATAAAAAKYVGLYPGQLAPGASTTAQTGPTMPQVTLAAAQTPPSSQSQVSVTMPGVYGA
jgi:hypothetical protein